MPLSLSVTGIHIYIYYFFYYSFQRVICLIWPWDTGSGVIAIMLEPVGCPCDGLGAIEGPWAQCAAPGLAQLQCEASTCLPWPQGLSHLRLPVGRGILNMFAISIFRRIYMMSLVLGTAQEHEVCSYKRNILSADINLINADMVP